MLGRSKLWGSKGVLVDWAASAKAWAAPYMYVTEQAWPSWSMARHPWEGWGCAGGVAVIGRAGGGKGSAVGH